MVILMVCDRIIGSAISTSAMKKAKDKRIGKILAKELNADLVIIGSSRAARNFVGSEIAKTSGLTVFNLGLPGSNIDFHAELLKLAIDAGNAPRYVILAVDSQELIDDKSVDFRYDVFYPYIHDDRIARLLEERGKLTSVSHVLSTYKQKNNLWTAATPGNKIDALERMEVDGSMPLSIKSITYDSMKYKQGAGSYSTRLESPFLIERFKAFIKICQENKIKLFIVVSPNYADTPPGLIPRLKQLTGDTATYFDYSQLLRDKENYYDVAHLNKNGAVKLSSQLGSDIKHARTNLVWKNNGFVNR